MSGATLGLVTPAHAASDGDLRIEDGPSDNEGRLEIFHDGEWGAVCDDFFSDVDADVACKQLGYTGGRSLRGKWPAPGDMSIWLDNVDCTGSESRLDTCPHPGWGQHNCAAREAVGVRCSGTRQISEPPPAPQSVTAQSVEELGQVTVTWTAPEYDGVIAGYQVRYGVPDLQLDYEWEEWVSAQNGAAARSYTFTGLTTFTFYGFQVRATAGNTPGAESEPVLAQTGGPRVSLIVPDDIQNDVHGNFVKEGASVTIDAVLTAQPSESVSILVESGDPGAVAVSPALLTFTTSNWNVAQPVTVTGVQDSDSDNEYHVSLTLSEDSEADELEVGNGNANITVYDDDPSTPLHVKARPGDGHVALSWTAPHVPYGNDEITGYEYRMCRGSAVDCSNDGPFGQWQSAGSSTSYQLTSLDNGQAYSFQVRAVAGQDKGLASPVVTATPGFHSSVGLTVGWVHLDLVDEPASVQERFWSHFTITGNPFPPLNGITAGRKLNFAATTRWASGVRSVKLELSGPKTATRTDSTAPFTLFEDYVGEVMPAGEYTLKATSYSGVDAGGTAGTPKSVTFTLAADNDKPTVRILCAEPGSVVSPSTGKRLGVEVLFSELVSGFGADDIEVTNVAESAVFMSASPTVLPTPYSVDFTIPADSTGAMQVKVPADAALDPAGNGNTAATPLNLAQNRTLSVSDASATEGTDATIDFEVTLNAANDCETVTVEYATSDGTATAGADYTAASGTLTFGPGETTKTVEVAVVDDDEDDSGETFTLTLSSASGATIADAQATGTINNDELLAAKVAGSVLPAQGGSCAVEVSVEFLDAGGNAVAVGALAASDFTAANGRVGTPVADADGLGWTVPVQATTNERGLLRVRLPATARWRATEQVFHNHGAGVCATAARGELATLLVDDVTISPSFNSTTTSYTGETTDAEAEVVATAVYDDATVTIAPDDADGERDGHQVALAEGETEVTVTVTPGDGSDAKTYTVTVTRELAVTGAGVLTGFVLVDASTDADLGPIAKGGTVTVSAANRYGIRAEVNPDAEVGSVVLTLSNPVAKSEERRQTENVAPYSLFGDAEGAEHGRSLVAGSYTLTATAHEQQHGAGKVLGRLRVPFTVEVEAGTSVLTDFTLLDASDQSTLVALEDGATVDLSGNFGTSFAIRADVAPAATVRSVTLLLTGAKTKAALENLAPYSLYGDRDDGAGGRALDGSSLPAGSYMLHAKAYAGARASGAVLGTRSVSFEVLRPPALRVVNAHAIEGTNAHLPFGVWLDRESTTTVTVNYTTVDGTAVAGSDYTATSGTLTFAAGETRKTVMVPVLEDDHDEGSETLTLRLSNPQGAIIAKGEGIGTITNDDPIPEAWLARFGRTVTGQVLDAVEARLTAPRTPGTQASLAGQALPSWRPGSGAGAGPGSGDADATAAAAAEQAEAEARQALASMTAWLAHMEPDPGPGFETRALTERDLIAGTSFALTAKAGDGRGAGHVSLWGRGSIAGFDGREGALTVDGEVTTGLIGADWASDPHSGSGRWTAGLALGHSTGTGGWRGANGSGAIEATLTGLYPYAGMDLTDHLSVWAAAGYGAGEVTVTPDGEAGLTADLTMAMGAAGLRSEVVRPEEGNGFVLAVKGDARFTRTSSDAVRSEDGNLAASEADVWLLRTGLEGSRPVALGDGGVTLTPSFEIGLRLDGGDAETGMGADLGGGIAFADPANGVALDMKARGLVAHETPGFREWGASLAASWDPRPATDLGLALTLRQSWGTAPAGGMDGLLSRETLADLAANDDGVGRFEAAGRLEGELGYGIALSGGRFTATPNVGFARSGGGARDWRVGWRLTPAVRGGAGFEVSFDVTRREPADGAAPGSGTGLPVEHDVMLRGAVRW